MSYVFNRLVRHRDELEQQRIEHNREAYVLQTRIDAIDSLTTLMAKNDTDVIDKGFDELVKIIKAHD